MRKNLFIILFCLFCLKVPSGMAETHVYFSADVDLSLRFVEQIDVETSSIRMAYCRLSNPKIIEALIFAQRRGVLVEVIVDRLTVTKKCLLTRLVKEGIVVLVWQPWGGEGAKAHMYHAFCVFGDSFSWIGPCSFHEKGHRESACLLQNRAVSARFIEEFERMKAVYTVSLMSCLDKKKNQ